MYLGGYLVLIAEVFFTILCVELEQVSARVEVVGIFDSKAFHGRNGTKEGRGGIGTHIFNASITRSIRVARDVSTIKFFLYVGEYTAIENGMRIYKGYKQHLLRSGFIRDAPTKIICHGYASSYREGPGESLVPAYLAAWKGRPLNVINIDWSQMSSPGWLGWDEAPWAGLYSIPAFNTKVVGHTVGVMIEFLVNELGIGLDKFHLIGHSLGAHVMGYAGRYLNANKLGLVGRITALDPARPCFEIDIYFCSKGMHQPINRYDAAFVDAIHTNAQMLGMKMPVGDADFYPNGGTLQPECNRKGWYSGEILYSLSEEFWV